MYYKLLNDNQIIEVVASPLFVKQQKNGTIASCKIENASGILTEESGRVYQVEGWKPFPNLGLIYPRVRMIEIGYDEYEQLSELLKSPESSPTPEEPTPIAPELVTLETYREKKIEKMREECSKAIVAGVSVQLSNGTTEHFDLQIEDQINILSLVDSAKTGNPQIYHSSNAICKLYKPEDIMVIAEAAAKHRVYHTTYFNSIKHYINCLTNTDRIALLYYGIEIPEEYQTEALKTLLK